MIIYVIKCEQEKYYIGSTQRSMELRYPEHKNGEGSKWTRTYKPISYKILENNCPLNKLFSREHEWTIKYVQRYGFRNVRGGNYLSMKPDCYTKFALFYFLSPIKKEIAEGLHGLLDPAPGFATFP